MQISTKFFMLNSLAKVIRITSPEEGYVIYPKRRDILNFLTFLKQKFSTGETVTLYSFI